MELERGIVLYMKGWVDGYIKSAGKEALGTEKFREAATRAAEKVERELFALSTEGNA